MEYSNNNSTIMDYYPYFSNMFPHSNHFINNEISRDYFMYHEYMIAYLGYILMVEKNVKEISFFINSIRSIKKVMNAFQDLKNEDKELIKKNDYELEYKDGTKIVMFRTRKNTLRGPNINSIIIYFGNFYEQTSFYETEFFLEIIEPLRNMKLNISIFILQEKEVILPPKTSYTIKTIEYKC